MKKQLEAVEEFHVKFGIGAAPEKPSLVKEEVYNLRYNLMKEENEEYLEACKNHDLVEIADALGDKLYILCGTIQKHGLGNLIEEIFDEIQRSNMSKLDENGNAIVREDGKILKSSRYTPPVISPILYNINNTFLFKDKVYRQVNTSLEKNFECWDLILKPLVNEVEQQIVYHVKEESEEEAKFYSFVNRGFRVFRRID